VFTLLNSRYFGTFRVGSNLIPDDINGLPSTHITQSLPTDSQIVLYQAEIDHGKAFECCQLTCIYLTCCGGWIPLIATQGMLVVFGFCTCDEMCCWIRKEYSTRTFFRVYSNRIVLNVPRVRFPYGYLGCGSWSADTILTHPFDRGAFGFSRVHSFTTAHICGVWPAYGGAVARHRCQCNGPLWNRMFTDCGKFCSKHSLLKLGICLH
jgi:hypothetical protein